MPLRKGHSRAVVSENISTLVREGYPQGQAIAIAMREAGIKRKGGTMSRKKRKRHSGRKRRMSAKARAACLRNLKKARAARRRRKRR